MWSVSVSIDLSLSLSLSLYLSVFVGGRVSGRNTYIFLDLIMLVFTLLFNSPSCSQLLPF